MKLNRKLLIATALTIGVVTACKESALDLRNPNQLTPDTYFKNAGELQAGINAAYAILQGNGLVGREWFFLNHLRGDDFQSGGGQLEAPRNQVLLGTHRSDNYVTNEVWNALYRTIHRANTVIQQAPLAADAASDQTKRVVGEARTLRAWSYSELLNFWGGVPIYKQTASSPDDSQARATEADVINFILEDLTAAEPALPLRYEGAEVGRVTRGVAQMLKARVLMFKGDFTAARAELQKIVSSGVYKLTNAYSENFQEESKWNSESLFEIGYAQIGDINWSGTDGNDPSWGNQERNVRTQEYSPTGWRNLIPSQSLIDEFESVARGDAKTDPRRAFSFLTVGDKFNVGQNTLTDALVQGNTQTLEGKTTKVSWLKYSLHYKTDPGGFGTSGINYRLIRYPEVLLALAECENELGNSAAAVTLLNQVRGRASVAMPPYPTARFKVSNKDEVFAAIVHEKRVELNGEEVRNRDLVRWRRQNKLTGALAPKFQYQFESRLALLPIPQSEIDNNTKIGQAGQNPGY